MSFSTFNWVDMGSFEAFRNRFEELTAGVSSHEFRLSALPQQGFWLFEQEDDEEILGGILFVVKDRLFAISQDVFRLVTDSFERMA